MVKKCTDQDNDGKEIYVRHAELCKVFSHPTRLEVISILRKGEMTVTELAERLNVGMGNLSQHLGMMKQRQILVTRKTGNTVYYRLAYPKMLGACDIMRQILFEQVRNDGRLIKGIRKK